MGFTDKALRREYNRMRGAEREICRRADPLFLGRGVDSLPRGGSRQMGFQRRKNALNGFKRGRLEYTPVCRAAKLAFAASAKAVSWRCWVSKRVFVGSMPLAVVLLGLIFGLQTANADLFDITITDATFSATCVGGTGTCTEIVNGAFRFNSVTFAASSISLVLSGTLATTLDGYGGAGFGPGLIFLDFFMTR